MSLRADRQRVEHEPAHLGEVRRRAGQQMLLSTGRQERPGRPSVGSVGQAYRPSIALAPCHRLRQSRERAAGLLRKVPEFEPVVGSLRKPSQHAELEVRHPVIASKLSIEHDGQGDDDRDQRLPQFLLCLSELLERVGLIRRRAHADSVMRPVMEWDPQPKSDRNGCLGKCWEVCSLKDQLKEWSTS